MRYLRDAERQLGVQLTDNGSVWFRASDGVACTSREGFQQLVEHGAVSPDTVVFDNTIQTIGALREGHWEIPAHRSWHARAFFSKHAAKPK